MVDWNNAVLAIHYEQLEYVTNDHIAMHTILFKLKIAFSLVNSLYYRERLTFVFIALQVTLTFTCGMEF